jgi:hypothetical protein
MSTRYGGTLPVYSGRRYQRGGGILSSIARFVLPTAKKLLTETVSAAPRVINSIVNEKQSAKSAVLRGLKTAGMNTVRDTFNRMGVRPQNSPNRKRRHSKQIPIKKKRSGKRRKLNNDIFS